MHRVFMSLALLSGCVADAGDESFIIRSNLAPPTGGGECFFTASVDAPAISRGQIVLDSTTPYLFNPLFESRITAADGRESLRTIFLEGANVDLEVGPIEVISNGVRTVDETVEPFAFRSLFSAPLPPNGGVTSAQFDLVPVSVLFDIQQRVGAVGPTDHVAAQITATITAFGDYYGESIEASPFTYPVTACTDCVLGNRDATGAFPLCSEFAGQAREGNPCNVFQDGVVDCCDLGSGKGIMCPAVMTGGGGN